MIVEVGGGIGGFKTYMENGSKVGRNFDRNQLDQRVPLIGDLNVFELSISLHDGGGRAYDHVTLSFSEHHVGNKMLQITVNDFLDHALFAWTDDERYLIPTYAEAHRPRILSYVNSGTRELVSRFTHIHVGIGRHDILTGRAIEPLGYLGPRTDNLKFIDAWQESFNARYGFTSPKNNPRESSFNTIDAIARYEDGIPDESFLSHGAKVSFEAMLQKVIVEINVTAWIQFGELLATYGIVSRVNEGRFGECYRVKLKEDGPVIRLKGVFFQRQFIELPTEEKIRILKQRASSTYCEQMLPRAYPAQVSEVLGEWQEFKAKEFRYLNTGSAFYKNVYLPASKEERLTILNHLESSSHVLTRHSIVKNRAIATAASRLPALQIRTLDGIRERTEMLLQTDGRLDVRIPQAADAMGSAVRRANSRRAQRDCEAQGFVAQPSSVLDRAVLEMEERHERSATKDRDCEIEKSLDCHTLLQSLKASHGLNPSLYRVVAAQDGTVRIQCGSRSIKPSEFLTVELGLSWRDAAPIFQATHNLQIQAQAAIQSGKVAGLTVEQRPVDRPTDAVIAGHPKNVSDDGQYGVAGITQYTGEVKKGRMKEVPGKILSSNFKSGTKKSKRRGSDYGI